MLARRWIGWEDDDDDASASLFPCLGIAPVSCDTHGEEEDWDELRALLRLCPDGEVGYLPRRGYRRPEFRAFFQPTTARRRFPRDRSCGERDTNFVVSRIAGSRDG